MQCPNKISNVQQALFSSAVRASFNHVITVKDIRAISGVLLLSPFPIP
jgi:hypothetical protein